MPLENPDLIVVICFPYILRIHPNGHDSMVYCKKQRIQTHLATRSKSRSVKGLDTELMKHKRQSACGVGKCGIEAFLFENNRKKMVNEPHSARSTEL